MTKKDKITMLFDWYMGQISRKALAKAANASIDTVNCVLYRNKLMRTQRLAALYRDSKNHIIIKVDKQYVILRKKYGG